MHTVRIMPHGALMFRDPRPSVVGGTAKSRDFPPPSVTAGTVRTLRAKQLDMAFTKSNAETLLSWSVLGPLLALDNEIFFPVPQDLQVRGGAVVPLRPLSVGAGSGVNLPHLLRPIGCTGNSFKPEPTGRFLAAGGVYDWLADPPAAPPLSGDVWFDPSLDPRTRLKMNNTTETAEAGMLYTTEMVLLDRGRGFPGPSVFQAGSLLVRFDQPIDPAVHRIGGDGGIARFEAVADEDPWPSAPPDSLANALAAAKRVRMQLATPAFFKAGWCPDWLDPAATPENSPLRGSPPGASGHLELELVGACVPRWRPLGGWDLLRGGPKPLRRLVPAGSVYFFQVKTGDPRVLASDLWLRSVCTNQQERDGFGLALWGVWS